MKEAVYLGTEVVVVSPRPGRIIEQIGCHFAGQAGQRDIRTLKSSAEFFAMRERV